MSNRKGTGFYNPQNNPNNPRRYLAANDYSQGPQQIQQNPTIRYSESKHHQQQPPPPQQQQASQQHPQGQQGFANQTSSVVIPSTPNNHLSGQQMFYAPGPPNVQPVLSGGPGGHFPPRHHYTQQSVQPAITRQPVSMPRMPHNTRAPMIPTPGTNVGQNGPQDQSYHNSGHGPVALTNNMNGYGQVQQIYSVPLHQIQFRGHTPVNFNPFYQPQAFCAFDGQMYPAPAQFGAGVPNAGVQQIQYNFQTGVSPVTTMDPGRFPTQPQQASGQAVTGQPRPHPTPTPPNPPQVPGTQSMMAPMMNIPTISYYQPAQQQTSHPNLQKRERNPLKIVDPKTNTEISLDNNDEQTPKEPATVEPSVSEVSMTKEPAGEISNEGTQAQPVEKVVNETEKNSLDQGSGLQVNEHRGAGLSENLQAATNIHSEKTAESSQTDNVVADAIDASKPPSVFNNTEFEPVSPTPLPETPGQDNDGFIEAKSRNNRKKAPVGIKKSETFAPRMSTDSDVYRDACSTTASSSSTTFASPATTPDVSPPLVFGQDVSLIAAMEKEASSEEAVEAKFENTTPRQTSPSENSNHVGVNSYSSDSEQIAKNGDDKTHSPPSSKSGSQVKLKYNYKDYQWSPINIDGRKQYDRTFLLELQNDPLSQVKPPNLPPIEGIVRDKSLAGSSRSNDDFMPGFVRSLQPRGNSMTKKPSRDMSGGKPRPMSTVQKVIPLKIERVELHQAENAWKPLSFGATPNGEAEKASEEDLVRKARGILNKLCPQRFDKLVDQFAQLQIDTEQKMNACMELIFEKAVDEPGFSVAYAKMCATISTGSKLSAEKVEGQEKKNLFRKLLLSKCQAEFEKDYMDGMTEEKKNANLEAATTPEAKKQIQLEWEEKERINRRRSLGIIKFIGELFKLNMLSSHIMHSCVAKLLKSKTDEESLESFCKLISTVGSRLEAGNERAPEMENYFVEVKNIIDGKSTSSRVRFMLQDVVDLRKNKWNPRREVEGPMTIDQVHQDHKREQIQQRLNDFHGKGRDTQGQNDRGSLNDPRKRTGRGQGQTMTEDGWSSVSSKTPQRQTAYQEQINTDKISSLANRSRIDGEPALGRPPSAWVQGSGSSQHLRSKDDVTTSNKFAMLLPNNDSGPSSFGSYMGLSGNSQENSNFDRRGSAGPSRSMGLPPKASIPETDRQRALEAAKRIGHKPSGSAEQLDGREDQSFGGSVSMFSTPRGRVANTVSPLKGSKDASSEDLEKEAKMLFEEFKSSGDEGEAISCICAKVHESKFVEFLNIFLSRVLDESISVQKKVGGLLNAIVNKKIVRDSLFADAWQQLILSAEDFVVDIPKFWEIVGELLAPLFAKQTLPLSFLKPIGLEKPELREKYLASVLKAVSAQTTPSKLEAIWAASALDIEQFVAKDKVQNFVDANRLNFITSCMSPDAYSDELTVLLNTDSVTNEQILAWMKKTVGPMKFENVYIRALVSAVATHAHKVSPENVEALIVKRKSLLIDVIESNRERELQAIYSLQHTAHKLEHPRQFLCQAFSALSENDVVSPETFFKWKDCADPVEHAGKGVAINATCHFFTMLTENDD